MKISDENMMSAKALYSQDPYTQINLIATALQAKDTEREVAVREALRNAERIAEEMCDLACGDTQHDVDLCFKISWKIRAVRMAI